MGNTRLPAFSFWYDPNIPPANPIWLEGFLDARFLSPPRRPARACAARAKVDFTRDILPILSDKCFHCHGPDKSARKAKLRLDEEASAKKEVILPGKSAESEVVKRLLSKDPSEQMPPPKLNRPMTKEQIDLVRRWIDEGAVWGKHWAFTPLAAPPVPTIKGVKNPIDAFIVARLEKEKLSLSPAAAPEAILRRVKLDLTGLPPTLEEIAAFAADSRRPRRAEKMVARILDSPAFGERMALGTGSTPPATPTSTATRATATARCIRARLGRRRVQQQHALTTTSPSGSSPAIF